MSGLRRRNITDTIPPQKKTQNNSDETQTRLLSTFITSKRFLIFLSVAMSAFFWFHTRVPSAAINCYAICSRTGARIYTVDDANPTVQCLVVRDEFIVDTGSLGAS